VARTKRTTKKLAQRIDLQYFQRSHRFRTWRFGLSVLLPVLAVIWLAGYGVARNNHIYSSGRMSPAHAVLTQRCDTCHVTRVGFFRATSNDQACLTCHDGPIHHSNQAFTPACANCHVEHRGQMRLAATANESCAQCHANLQTRGIQTSYVRNITAFSDASHPEFAALRVGYIDPGTVKLNHAVHLKTGLKGPNGQPVQLDCDSCHASKTANQAWRYGIAPGSPEGETSQLAQLTSVAPMQKPGPPSMAAARAYMMPIAYAQHCAGCHPLLFDARFKESAPHDTPEVVHAFLVKRFQNFIAAHPDELREPVSTVALPARPLPVSPRVYMPPQKWVDAKVAEAEQLLWGKTCKQCHALSFSAGASLPAVAKSNITVRWFQHAIFDHDQHRLVNCESCHTRSRTSQETADVLLPSIRTCEQCHHSGPQGAAARCFECHTYHDWKNEKEVKSKFTLSELARGKESNPSAENSSREAGK
jgi:hypothetical protein